MKKWLYPIFFAILSVFANVFSYIVFFVFLVFIAPEKIWILGLAFDVYAFLILPTVFFLYGRRILRDTAHRFLFTVYGSIWIALSTLTLIPFQVAIAYPAVFLGIFAVLSLLTFFGCEAWSLLGLWCLSRSLKRAALKAQGASAIPAST